MEYKFGPWFFYPERCLLVSLGVEKELDPLAYKLLNYFLTQDQRIISRQELAEQVWKQKFVDDNAINRAISDLRKQLKYCDQQTQLIKTHHRKGYSITADVVQRAMTNEEQLQQDSITIKNTVGLSLSQHEEKNDPEKLTVKLFVRPQKNIEKIEGHSRKIKYSAVYFCLIGMFFLVLSAFVFYSYTADKSTPLSESITPVGKHTEYHAKKVVVSAVTWDPGAEYNPLVSDDGKYLAYRNHRNNIDTSFIRRIKDNKQVPLLYQNSIVRVLSWQPQKNIILASIIKQKHCQFALFDLNNFPTITEPKILIPCGKTVNNSAQLTFDASKLYFTKAVKGYSGASIYQYDLQSNKQSVVIPPSDEDYGVLHFKLSPNDSAIAYLTANFSGPMKAYLHDFNSDENRIIFQFVFEWNSLAINWSKDNSQVVIADNNKLHKINVYNNAVETIILPQGERPYNLEIEHEQQILYTPYILRNTEVVKAGNLFSDSQPVFTELYHSDRNSYKPALGLNNDLGVFFASNRTGSHQIWQVNNAGLKQLTFLDNSTDKLGVPRVSHSGRYVLFKHHEQLKIIKLENKRISVLTQLPLKMRHYFWSTDDSAIIYSTEKKGTSQIWQFDILTRKNKLLAQTGGETLLANNQGAVFYIKAGYLINLNRDDKKKVIIPDGVSRFKALTENYLYTHDALTTLYRTNINTGTVEKATLLLSLGPFTVMPDDSAIFFTRYSLADTYIQRLSWQ